jgi:hypothetical protein
MVRLDDTQRNLLGGLGVALLVTGPPLRALFGVVLLAVAFRSPR